MQNNLKYEEEIIKYWKENKIYDKVQEKNSKGDLFNHIDGPPYPTGEVHLGHLRNWTIKDSVLRFRRFQGYNVYARDGYDANGLPVENKVQKKLGLTTVKKLKEFGEENFVKECKSYVNQIIDNMAGVRERFALWMDRDPYYTFHTEYLSLSWRFFKKAEEKGLLYKDYKTVGWCPHDETTLSDYELKDTYAEMEDPSIYIKFPVKKEFTTTGHDEFLVIWTTTPWTLQSNMLIAVNPDYEYSKVLVDLNGKKEVLIIADSLVDKVLKKISKQNKIEKISILETKKGAEYEGIKYEHIYLNETPSQLEFVKKNENKHLHSVVLADYVTLDEGEDIIDKLEKKGYKHSNTQQEDKENNEEKSSVNNDKKAKSEGTGLVHTAPGHGFDDYSTGKKYNVPIFCPIDTDGTMMEGIFKGMYFKEIDEKSILYLKEKGYLLFSETKKHRYPCCWRCKTPIVYRAAEQWWIKRSEYIKDIIKANSNVKWYPESAKTSFNNLISTAGDWAISRQRYWGIPLPIFEDEDGNYEVFGSKEELEARIGYKLEDIHRDELKKIKIINPKNGKEMKSVPFIADVWFDSGCASFASHYNEGLTFDEIAKKYYPIKWVTESEDQIRGWFSSLFNVGYLLFDKAPYKEVLYYRFVMDKLGQKMSKSLGNGISGNECIEKWGTDKTRYYLSLKKAPEEQINFDSEEFSTVDGFFNMIDNVYKFMNEYLAEYSIKSAYFNLQNAEIEDKWILYRLNVLTRKFVHYFEDYKIHLACKELENFLTKDLSKTYLKLIKERTESIDEHLYFVFEKVLKHSLILLASIIPFKAEHMYLNMSTNRKKESIFLESIPVVDDVLIKEVDKESIDENFELVQDIIQSILNAREKVQKGVRWPLPQVDLILNKDINLSSFENLIKKLTNIKKINYDVENVDFSYSIKPNFLTLKEDFKDLKAIINVINSNKLIISEDIKHGQVTASYENINIDLQRHIIKEIVLKDDLVSSSFSLGNIILHTHQDEILLEEGFVREIIRRVQDYRKELGLNKSNKISLSFNGSDANIMDIVNNFESMIQKKVGALEILQHDLECKKEFDIKESKMFISYKLVE